MQYFFLILIFLFGAALGSFVAAIVDRYNTGLPFLKGRSICFSCNTRLQKKDLAPIFSFLFLGGKCRYCQSKIPTSAFIVEIVMGMLSVLAASKSGFSISNLSIFPSLNLSLMPFASYLLLTFIFTNILLISVYDLKHFIIPDSFLISLFIPSFLYLSISNLSIFPSLNFSFLLPSFLSGIVLALPFLLIFLISKGAWMGFGDVKYIAVLGFFLGFIQGLSAVVLAFWIGAAFSLLALSFKYLKPHISLPLFKNNLTIKSEVPFGPFLSLGIILSFYFNADLFQIHSFFNTF